MEKDNRANNTNGMRTESETVEIIVEKLKKMFSSDLKVGMASIDRGIKKGEDAYQLIERGLKRRVQSPAILELRKMLDDALSSDKSPSNLDNFEPDVNPMNPVNSEDCDECVSGDEPDDDTVAASTRVPFIADENLVLLDKSLVAADMDEKMLEIANMVMDTDTLYYDAEDFNFYAAELKKKERRYLKGQAEMLKWIISSLGVKVNSRGHRMLSHMVETY